MGDRGDSRKKADFVFSFPVSFSCLKPSYQPGFFVFPFRYGVKLPKKEKGRKKMKKITKSIVSLVLVLAVMLSMPISISAAEKVSPEKEYLSYSQFRGEALSQGIVDSKTPVSKESTVEKWGIKFGTGWSDVPGTPVIVGDYLYCLVAGQSKLYRVDANTGEILKSVPCPGKSQFFSTIAYYDGVIYVPRAAADNAGAVIIAYDEETMEQLWISEPLGGANNRIQPLSAVTGYDGHIYVGVSDGSASEGAYVCFDTVDENPKKTDEVKAPVWTYKPENMKSGYYWSAGAIVGDAIIFGGEATELVIHSLTEDKVYDTLVLEPGAASGIRSSVHYDAKTNRVFVALKSGNIYSVKLSGDNTFDTSSMIKINIGNDITSSPVVFGDRLYIGGGGISSGNGFTVMNSETLEIIYQIDEVKTQASPIVTTAYATEENGYEVKMYVTGFGGIGSGGYDPTSSCVYMITDRQGQTEPEYEIIATPSQLQYCTQSAAIGGDGSIYFYNDSGTMYCFSHKDAADGEYTAKDMINAISLFDFTGVTERDEYRLNRLKLRYDLMSDSEKTKVTNYESLEEMLEKIENLKNEEKIVAELNEYIKNVNPDELTLKDSDTVNSWYAKYNALSTESKALVENSEKLLKCVAVIENLKNQDAAANLNKKIAELPDADKVTLKDRDKILEVLALYEMQNDEVKKMCDSEKLLAAADRANELFTKVQAIDERIFNEIDPLNITLETEKTVSELEKEYSLLSETDREYVTRYDDVLFARKVIDSLKKGVIISEMLMNLAGSPDAYTAEYENAVFSFKGTDITDPTKDFNISVTFGGDSESDIKALYADAFVFTLNHEGALPAKTQITLKTSLSDGEYKIYRFENSEAVSVGDGVCENGSLKFTAQDGGIYFAVPVSTSNPGNLGDNIISLGAMGGASLLAVLLLGKRKKR